MRANNKIIHGSLVAVAAIALFPLGLFGEAAPDSITVDEAVRAALANNLQVRSAEIESRIKKRASDFSFNKFLPSVTLSGTAAQSNAASSILMYDPASSTSFYYPLSKTNLLLSVGVQEVFNATYFGLMDQAAIDYQKSLISKAQAEKGMTATVKKIFYQLLMQDEAIALTRSRLDSAKERLRQAELSYKLGQASELNYQYAMMSVESLAPDLRALESGRAAALTQFQQALGYDSRPDMRLVGSIDGDAVPTEPPSASEYERFDVLLAQQGEKQLESALKIQRYALLPSLILAYKADPMLNGPQDNSVWDSDNWHQSSGALSITLSWSLDALLPASAIRVAKAEVQDRLSLARAAEAFALRAGRDEAASQERDLRDSVDRIANLSNVADAAKRAYELTNAAYQLGAGRFLDLQDSEVAWQGARMQLLAERLKLAALVFDFEAKFRSR